VKRVVVAPCPYCSANIEYLYYTEEIPYFSEILITSASCPCGYRLTDTMVIGESKPVRYIFPVQEPSDLNARVVRSTTGTIEIPEFGVNIEPGPICEGFISNVEGVLDRVERAVNMALSWTYGDELENAIKLQATIQEAREGKVPFTLIIQDQDGNSAIIHPNAVKEPALDEDNPKQDDVNLKDKS